MQHNIVMEGHAFRLRPVAISDARFILDLRTDPARNSFIHETANDLNMQIEWIERYFRRVGDYYFIIESKNTGEREGTIGIYNIDPQARCGEWGRWIVVPQSMAALESAFLIYEVAFSMLKLNMVYARTAVLNTKVIAFHDACGLDRQAVLSGFLSLPDGKADAIEHTLSKEKWRALKSDVEAKVERLAGMLGRTTERRHDGTTSGSGKSRAHSA